MTTGSEKPIVRDTSPVVHQIADASPCVESERCAPRYAHFPYSIFIHSSDDAVTREKFFALQNAEYDGLVSPARDSKDRAQHPR